MNILLVQPKFKKKEIAYPLGLASISAFLKSHGHKVYGIDLSFDDFDKSKNIIKEKLIELIGVSLMSYNINNAVQFCNKIKKFNNMPPIVGGGPHVTIYKNKLFELYSCFDYLIAGEGEKSFLQLINVISAKKNFFAIDGVIYKKNEKIFIDRTSKINNLDDLPYADRKIFNINNYKGMTERCGKYTQITTSRGCNNLCKHCPEPSLYKKWIGKPIENIIGEIIYIKNNYGIKDFHIEDSNFFGGGVERIKEFCHKIKEKNLDIKWQCPNGIPVQDIDNAYIFSYMAKAGCYNICLGIECFDTRINRTGKLCDYKKIKKLIIAAQRQKIEVVGYFIIGFPGQRVLNIIKNIFLSMTLKLDFIQYSIFDYIPGSYFHSISEDTKQKQRILLKILRSFSYFLNCFRPRQVIFIYKNLITIKSPIKFFKKAINCLFDFDF